MGKYSKYKNRLEKFLQTERGKRFLNFAYSFGAAIVIMGAMFKILYLPFGNVMLAIGMITEIGVFILSAFDTPVKDYNWEEVFPVLATNKPEDRPDFAGGGGIQGGLPNIQIGSPARASGENAVQEKVTASSAKTSTGSQPIVVNISGNPSSYRETVSGVSGEIPPSETQGIVQPKTSAPLHTEDHIEQLSSVSNNVRKFADATETLTKISESLQESYKHIIDNSQNISQNSLGYVQQMEALNRNIGGLNTIYEIQLKSISGQLDSIEQINNGLTRIKQMYNEAIPDSSVIKQETDKMAVQLRELNQVYARMIEAMTNSQHAPRNP